MSTDQFTLYKILASHRAGARQGYMWPEGLPLGYVNSGLYAIHKWATRELTCSLCKQEANALEFETLEFCLTCTKEVLQDIVDALKIEMEEDNELG